MDQMPVDSAWSETMAERDVDKAYLAGICLQNCAFMRTMDRLPATTRWTMWDVYLGLGELAQHPPAVADPREFVLSWSTMTSRQASEFFTCILETAHVRPYIIIMNFANGKHGGGGDQNGARAQEESLCREFPPLFHSLRQYYDPAKEQGRSRNYPLGYGSDVLVTDLVDCLRGDQGNSFAPLCETEQHMVSFVSAAAPDLRSMGGRFMPEVLRQQMRNVIYAPLLNKLQRV